MKYYIWSIVLYGAEIWTIRKIDQKYIENVELWRWKRMETSWTDRVKKKEKSMTKSQGRKGHPNAITQRKAT